MWQPHASLVSTGAKRWETRSWGTQYRGPLLICAGKRKDLSCLRLLREPAFQLGLEPIADVLGHGTVRPRDLPYGEAVALVKLTECITTEERLDAVESYFVDDDEWAFGDYSPGRFAWKLEDVIALPRGVPIGGDQQLWDQDMDEVLAVLTDEARELYAHMAIRRIAQAALLQDTEPLTWDQVLARDAEARRRQEDGEGEL
jgi:hypothetical protein